MSIDVPRYSRNVPTFSILKVLKPQNLQVLLEDGTGKLLKDSNLLLAEGNGSKGPATSVRVRDMFHHLSMQLPDSCPSFLHTDTKQEYKQTLTRWRWTLTKFLNIF